MKCNKCSNANVCLDHIEIPSLSGCTSRMPDRKVQTNADKIRSMPDEKLAKNSYLILNCKKCPKSKTCNRILDWSDKQ